jgi:hypothetical protein
MRLLQQAVEFIVSAHSQEASKRGERAFEVWNKAELQVVWSAARDFALQHGLRVPLMSDVEMAEKLAVGHTDYSRRLATYVAQRFVE